MRLMQLGMESFVVGDPTTPAITENDMLLAVSGSGDTETVYDMVCEAKKKKAMVWCITAKRNSRIAGRSDKAIIIHGKTKLGKGRSAQPLGSLFEQAALIYMDSLVVMIMERLGEEEGELRKRHTTLE